MTKAAPLGFVQHIVTCEQWSLVFTPDLPTFCLNEIPGEECVVVYIRRSDGWISSAGHGVADLTVRIHPDVPVSDDRR